MQLCPTLRGTRGTGPFDHEDSTPRSQGRYWCYSINSTYCKHDTHIILLAGAERVQTIMDADDIEPFKHKEAVALLDGVKGALANLRLAEHAAADAHAFAHKSVLHPAAVAVEEVDEEGTRKAEEVRYRLLWTPSADPTCSAGLVREEAVGRFRRRVDEWAGG